MIVEGTNEDIRREKKDVSRLRESRQRDKEEKEWGIKVTSVSMVEELGRRESKEARAKLKEHNEIWGDWDTLKM